MKKNSILVTACLIVLTLGFYSASAQITINIPSFPKIPKIKKDKPKQTRAQTENITEVSQPSDNQSSTVTESKNNEANNDSQKTVATNPVNDKCAENYWVKMVVDDLTQIKEDFDTYTPSRGWLYKNSPAFDYLLYTVSPRARQNWLKEKKEDCPSINAAFDKLAPSAAKVLPFFMPNKNNYAIQNAVTNNLIKSKISDLANHKIHYIGVKQPNWLIEKNSIGIPTARYKHGIAWVRYTPDDHQYCRLYYINVVSDYAGGGTYGASYGNYVNTEIVPCPAGAN